MFFITLIISLMSNVDLMHTMMVVTFVLTCDQMISRFIMKVYMAAIANEQYKNKDEDIDDQQGYKE
jgi:hypothetical protein